MLNLRKNMASALVGVVPVANGGTGLSIAAPSFSYIKSGTDQTGIVTGTPTVVTLLTAERDTNSEVSGNRHTPKLSGTYLYNAGMRWLGAVPSSDLLIRKNGATYTHLDLMTNAGGGGAQYWLEGAAEIPMTALTDYAEFVVIQGSGGNQTIYGNTGDFYCQGRKLG